MEQHASISYKPVDLGNPDDGSTYTYGEGGLDLGKTDDTKQEYSQKIIPASLSSDASSSTSKDALPIRLWRVLENFWLMDLAAVTLSASVFIGLAIFLNYFDGKRQPYWHQYSIPFVVSWFSRVVQLCIGLLLGRNIGQSKWVWFSSGKKRKLADISAFEGGSDGIAGPTQLIWMLKGRYVMVSHSPAALELTFRLSFRHFAVV